MDIIKVDERKKREFLYARRATRPSQHFVTLQCTKIMLCRCRRRWRWWRVMMPLTKYAQVKSKSCSTKNFHQRRKHLKGTLQIRTYRNFNNGTIIMQQRWYFSVRLLHNHSLSLKHTYTIWARVCEWVSNSRFVFLRMCVRACVCLCVKTTRTQKRKRKKNETRHREENMRYKWAFAFAFVFHN